MIISASRRTDIPAFYSEWLMNRLNEGYVLAANPRNPVRFSRISLNRQSVDCIVFWTKNPSPMLPKLKEISAMGYPFYFQFTLTPYGQDIEQNLPSKSELLQTFQKLAGILGPKRVVWRYDPVILTPKMDIGYHLRCFEKMAAVLEGCTYRCIFSFLDFYPRIRESIKNIKAKEIQETDMFQIAEGFSRIAGKHQMQLFTCCEPVDLSKYGVAHASCIDAGMIEVILDCTIHSKKDISQRPGCGCIESVDIGIYDSCPHRCKYCYAVSAPASIHNNVRNHDPKAPVLFGRLPEKAVITERKMLSVRDGQIRLPIL